MRSLILKNSLRFSIALSFFVRAIGAISALLFNIFVARELGAEQAGIFFLSVTIVLGLSLIGRFGLDNALIRWISPQWDNRKKVCASGVAMNGLCIALTISVILFLLLYIYKDLIAIIMFNDIKLIDQLGIMSFAVVPFTLVWVLCGVLKAIRLPIHANFVEAGAIPLGTTLIFIIMRYRFPSESTTVGIAYVSSTIITCILVVILVIFRMPLLQANKEFKCSNLLKTAYPMMTISILGFIILWSSSLFLGVFSDAKEVALYQAALRIATTVEFILIVVNSVTSSKYASYFSERKLADMESLAISTSALMTMLIFPIVAILIAFSKDIMGIFGVEYIESAKYMVIIIIGQIINVYTGSIGYILMMSGHEKLFRNNMAFTALLSILMNTMLVPKYGALGCAITTALCLIVQNFISVFLVYWKLKIRAFPLLGDYLIIINKIVAQKIIL